MSKPFTNEEATIFKQPVELLQRLIRFNTTNPPGDEAGCITYIDNLLRQAGFKTTILARDPRRPNLITRLAGQGSAPPLLLYGHVDVVTTVNQTWRHPPFEARVVDDYVWGRGALDMKGGVAMMLAALLRAKAEGITLPGDVILAVVSDEEAGGDYGARYLVENHADLFKGIRYAIGEFGGFTLHFGRKRLYPIMISEKQVCWIKIILRGPGGHGSLPIRGGAMAKLARVLRQLDKHRLPVHITPVARQMIEKMASVMPLPVNLVLRLLFNPRLTDIVLDLLGDRGKALSPLLHNTVSPTIVHASDKINVIPSEIAIELDGRLLPGYSPDDLMAELRRIIGKEVELELIRYDLGPNKPDMSMFDKLADILREADPGCIPGPLLLSGCSDARFFSRLGIQTYGFTPMKLPKGFKFMELIHGGDERIPVEALTFGTDAIYKLLGRFGNK